MPDAPRTLFELKGGMSTVSAADQIAQGAYAFLQNIRRLLGGRLTARAPIGANQLTSALPAPIISLTRMNDTTADGPPSGFVLIVGSGGNLYANATSAATGLSNDPLSFLPYRPSSSPQPFCYMADPSNVVTIPSYTASGYGTVTGMLKMRSDGTVYKTGIKEPQNAPSVSVGTGSGTEWVIYRYTYRDSQTGATSNPSPESLPQNLPQTSLQGTEAATSTNVTFNSSQYEINGSQLRTGGSVAPGTVTDYVIALNFGISVPSTVTIDGIQATMNWQGQFAGTGIISNVSLFYQGQNLGQTKSPGIQNSQSPTTAAQGGNADTWGAVLTPAIVNDTTFGVGFQITTAESGGSDRSFINNFTLTVYYTTVSAGVSGIASLDPQVDVIDFYRMSQSLDNFTYVGTVPNGTSVFPDTLSDLAVSGNPIISFENFEPFPSIGLPLAGTVNVTSTPFPGTVTLASGNPFPLNLLPGNIILINGIAYTTYNRPTSSTTLSAVTSTADPVTGFITITPAPAGTGQSYQIADPELANVPSPVIWGPTPDNAGSFYFGLDPNNPGDLLWSLGNNFDSAPDTNRLFVTAPNEPLMNGTVTSELSTVFSTDRFWLIYPNFADAVATVAGTLGQQWTLIQSASTRGLYMRYAIAALGSLLAFRAKDGIYLSQGGGPEQSITEQIYNLFPHNGQKPSSFTIAGNTVFPPDDTKPNAQTLSIIPGYIFYNYQDTTGTPRTLVYDFEAKGWTVDTYTPKVNYHSWVVGQEFETLVGCVDGTIRMFDSTATEAQTAIVVTRSENGGSSRIVKRIGGVFLRALAASAISVAFWANRFQQLVGATSPSSVGPESGENDFLFDFTNATGSDVLDLGMVLSFPVGSGNWLKEWQPDWTYIPEQIVAWRTGMLSYGQHGWMSVPWIRFAYSSTTAINLTITTDQGQVMTVIVPSSGGNPAKFWSLLPANKFKLMEWTADAGGNTFTIYAQDNELYLVAWGLQASTLRPFQAGFGTAGATT